MPNFIFTVQLNMNNWPHYSGVYEHRQ